MDEITNATGNVVRADGQPISWDLISDMLEKMPLDFDEQGNPLMPTMYASPEGAAQAREMTPTPEQQLRRSEIIERKRAEFYAQKRTRRLS